MWVASVQFCNTSSVISYCVFATQSAAPYAAFPRCITFPGDAKCVTGGALLTSRSDSGGHQQAGNQGSDVISAEAGLAVRRTASPLPYSQAPPLIFRCSHWLRGRPIGRQKPRALAARPWHPLSFARLASVAVTDRSGAAWCASGCCEAEAA